MVREVAIGCQERRVHTINLEAIGNAIAVMIVADRSPINEDQGRLEIHEYHSNVL